MKQKSINWRAVRAVITGNIIGIFSLFGLLFAGQAVWATWQDPTCDPTTNIDGCAVSAPLNVSSAKQTKAGALDIDGLLTAGSGLTVVNGEVNLPSNAIEGGEITDNTITEDDIRDHNGNGTGLDETEIDDIYLRKNLLEQQQVAGPTSFGPFGGVELHLLPGGATAAVFNGIVEAKFANGGYFKGDGFELNNVGSVLNKAAEPNAIHPSNRDSSLQHVTTATFYGDLAAAEGGSISLDNYGIAPAGSSARVIPISLDAMECLDCTDTHQTDWKTFDPVADLNFRYIRCENGNYRNNIFIQNGSPTQAGKFTVHFSFYLEEWAGGGNPPAGWQCNFAGLNPDF